MRKRFCSFRPAFQVTKLEPSAGAVKATIKVAADCRLGEHVAHVRTASGVTEYRTFYVGPFPEIKEKEPNTEFTTPQPIPMNVTVNGVIDVGGRRLLRRRRQEGAADQCRDRGNAARRHDVRPVYRHSRLEAVRVDHGRRHAALETGRGRFDPRAGRRQILHPSPRDFVRRRRELLLPAARGQLPAADRRLSGRRKTRRPGRGAIPRRSDRRHREEGQAAQPARS